ncbi:M23 family metallopeptidase [Fodinicola feengrottensis]|uniref:M23 family metallopeptidase n=1 Tax=Fodinicola feengrottensis TaxID=435914 RepID=UPI0031E05F0C
MAAVMSAVLVLAMGAVSAVSSAYGSCGGAGTAGPAVGDQHVSPVAGLSATQAGHAATIIAVGAQLRIPRRGWVIAIATALQESDLHNTANNNPRYPKVVAASLALPHDGVGADHDSVGLFQQRPVEGDGNWGTVRELMTPATSAAKFYRALEKVRGWQSLPVSVAAQRVQISAYPDAYAKHEQHATAIVDALAVGAAVAANGPASSPALPSGRIPIAGPITIGGSCVDADAAGPIAASGWMAPIIAPIVSRFRPPSRPTHNGVDLGGPRGTVIHAASAGVVRTVMCNASTGNCDVDGGLNVMGCGWYVDIAHVGGVITRYCHMARRPLVHIGQIVTVGQPIGYEGSSGNSSGPHVHFEVHLHNNASGSGAIDPVPFMAARGVRLGTAGGDAS